MWVPFPLDPLVVLIRRFGRKRRQAAELSAATGISKQTRCNRNTGVHAGTDTLPIVCYGSAIGSPAVVSSCADHVFVVVGEADVGHVSRVAEVALVFGLETEKTLTALSNKQ